MVLLKTKQIQIENNSLLFYFLVCGSGRMEPVTGKHVIHPPVRRHAFVNKMSICTWPQSSEKGIGKPCGIDKKICHRLRGSQNLSLGVNNDVYIYIYIYTCEYKIGYFLRQIY